MKAIDSDLDNLLRELTKILAFCHVYLEFEREIGFNAKPINKTHTGKAFGIIQSAIQRQLIVETTNLFSEQKGCISVYAILKEIKKNHINEKIKIRSHIRELLEKLNIQETECKNTETLLKSLHIGIKKIEKKDDIQNVIKVRHNHVAHKGRKVILKSMKPVLLPSDACWESCITNIDNFRKLIYSIYLPQIVFVEIGEFSSIHAESLRNLIKGVINDAYRNPFEDSSVN